jgi:radical SAM protein with 4Fe4S-binding SPASM domain
MNAIVFLSLKTKGRAKENNFHPVSTEKFKKLMSYALENKVAIGFDSCSGQKAFESVKGLRNQKELEGMIEPCESTLYSMYINTEGKFFPCSFAEGDGEWINGIDVVNCNDFLKDVWWNEKTLRFKNKVMSCRDCNKACPIYNV